MHAVRDLECVRLPEQNGRSAVFAGAAALCATPQLRAADAPGKPGRIVSLNMCVDELVLRLAQPRGNLDEAMQHLSIARDDAEVGIDARFALGDVYRRKGDPEGAVRELESALKSQPLYRRIRLALLDNYSGGNPPQWVDVERLLREARNLPQYEGDPEILRREAQM